MEDRPHKAHRPAHSGNKAEKKESKGKGKEKQHGFNEKAFAPKSGRNADRLGRRAVEKDQTRLHVPLVNRTPDDLPPPIIVAIVGPPGVGKTTLLKSLVRRYTKQTLSEPKGPITVVSGKKRRITFVECNNSLNSMIDIGKVADLVMLMIDGSFGFEMETFEFLNILQSHGFPKVIGVLTHLDLIKKAATLRASKKALKKRFWTEIYQGAKLFYLSGVLNGRYPDTEILNLSRFISVMKFRPLVFRNTHPYVYIDRIEDLTPRELVRTSGGKCDRRVSVYGYVRGTNLREGQKVHMPGVGDLDMESIKILGDPCPLPDADSEKRRKLSEKKKLLVHAPMSDVGGMIYDKDAVYINVPGSFTRRNDGEDDEGGIVQGEGERMVMDLQDAGMTLDDAVKQTKIRLFGSSEKPLAIGEFDEEDDEDEDGASADEEDQEDLDSDDQPDGELDEHAHTLTMSKLRADPRNTGRSQLRRPNRSFPSSLSANKSSRPDVDFVESDSDLGDGDEEDGEGARFVDEEEEMDVDIPDDNEDEDPSSQEDDDDIADEGEGTVHTKTLDALALRRRRTRRDWVKDIYSSDLSPEEILSQPSSSLAAEAQKPETAAAEDDGFFFTKKSSNTVSDSLDPDHLDFSDKSKPTLNPAELSKWEDEEMLESIRGLFITGVDAPDGDGDDEAGGDGEEGEGDDDEGGGDFVDFEAVGGDPSLTTAAFASSSTTTSAAGPSSSRDALASKKAALKARFDEEYDDPSGPSMDFYSEKKAEISSQLELNRAEFASITDLEARAQLEGYIPGTYVRIVLSSVPAELIQYFDPAYPLLLGGLLPAESHSSQPSSFNFVQVRLKRHRWFTRPLKTNDPLIVSLGWRRFQTIPIYSLDDHSIRMRMLKYTPEHMHCYGTFWGPGVLPNTGFCAFNTVADGAETGGFRISATGVVLSLASTSQIVKKLKLTGTPFKIFKNTAFIKGMFSSALEVAKFEGASVKTVSGVRGVVKKAVSAGGLGGDGKRKGGKGGDGAFRAAFEDKLLMSGELDFYLFALLKVSFSYLFTDIVFLRAWYSVQPRKFYAPVTSLLLPSQAQNSPSDADETPIETKQTWTGMRLTGTVRRSLGIKTPLNVNSTYRHKLGIEQQRTEKKGRFAPLVIPKSLQKQLPYKSKPKLMLKQGGSGSDGKRRQNYLQKRAVVLEPEEKRAVALLQQIRALRKDQVQRRKEKKEAGKERKRKEEEKSEERKMEKERERKKEVMRNVGMGGKRDKREAEAMEGGRRKKRKTG
ncbi:GTP binding protein [Lentinula guzmanii]|uniref:GTP binding protein n=1 Tax=Lentinula guzmanii TaxID=2804957 RepID=A0AA38JMR3_9AGAR|nr:GTP binding protein [Lentinula guzmanii]